MLPVGVEHEGDVEALGGEEADREEGGEDGLDEDEQGEPPPPPPQSGEQEGDVWPFGPGHATHGRFNELLHVNPRIWRHY